MDINAPVIAAIDVGTNSFHMVVASVNQRGMMLIRTREKEMVRLGSSAGDMKILESEAIKRGVETLKMFAGIAQAEKAYIRAVATSATREADNKADFLHKVKAETGIDIEVVSGAEEGRLIYTGVIHALPLNNKKAMVIDIGGGSTETIIGYNGAIQYVNSEKLGSIRLFKKFFPNGESSNISVDKCREFIRGEWMPIMKRLKEIGFDTTVGTSGTITNLALMTLSFRNEPIPEIINGLTVSREEILNVIKSIVRTKNTEERLKLPGIDPTRADIIIAGALILEFAIKQLGIDKIIISSYALREGILYDTVQKSRALQESHHLSMIRYETVYYICRQYSVDLPHAEHVKTIALKLFDETKSLHKLGDTEREFLEAASLMHDIGYHISHDQHHKHSYYIIVNSVLPGFTNTEAEMIANIARYHRKSHPKKKHENFKRLTPDKQRMVRILGGMLRIAEGVDRRQLQVIKDLDVKIDKSGVNISLIYDKGEISPDIELWGAERRKLLLEEVCRKPWSFILQEQD
jgi:exopolyphosphatase / guanosine-5'-triphosphate,3'-diphosphate pyrophosphatase